MKHTPKPWKVVSDKLSGHLNFLICDCNGKDVAGAYFQAPVATNDPKSRYASGQPEAWANANLIAAAPEMLEALKRLAPTKESGACDCEKGFVCKYCFARNAIAKADPRPLSPQEHAVIEEEE